MLWITISSFQLIINRWSRVFLPELGTMRSWKWKWMLAWIVGRFDIVKRKRPQVDFFS